MAQPVASGGCACGGVRYEIAGSLRAVTNCHCEPCRRITGHFMAATAASTDRFRVVNDDTLRWFERTPAVAYGFCCHCGSTLFWRADDKPDTVSIAAGTLDAPTGLTTELALFTAAASDYHLLDPTIASLPGDH